jgi:DNA-binding transcriptional LysR family regulator
MDTLQTMRIFSRIAEEGSFTVAAQRLNITTGNASRSVSQLEDHLRARLFNRSTRRVTLTDAGKRYLAHCHQILAYVETAEAEAADTLVKPSGRLRVHATTGFGQCYIAPAIISYQELHSEVSVELTLSQHVPDLIDEGYDVSLQLTSADLPDSSLVSHRLGEMPSVLCAAPAYLRKHGMPLTVQDLQAHVCLQIVSSAFPRNRWQLDGSRGSETIEFAEAPFRVNVADALGIALRAGAGIGALPMSSALPAFTDGTLMRVLQDYRLQSLHVYALYASRQYLDAKIRTFTNYLRDVVPKALAADEAALRAF